MCNPGESKIEKQVLNGSCGMSSGSLPTFATGNLHTFLLSLLQELLPIPYSCGKVGSG